MLIALLQQVDTLTHQFVFDGYQHLATYAKPMLIALMTLYIVIMGYEVLSGTLTISLRESIQRILLVGCIFTFALNWGRFSETIYILLTKAPDEIAGQLLNHPSGINASLQDAFTQGMQYANALWEHGAFPHHILPFIYSLLMQMLLIALMGFATIELVVSKFLLSLLLVLTPIILPLWLFQATKSAIVDGWLRQLIAYALIPLCLTCALSFALSLFSTVTVHENQLTDDVWYQLPHLLTYFLYALISIGLVRRAPEMANHFAGTCLSGASPYLDRALFAGMGGAQRLWHAGKWGFRKIKR